MRSGETTCGAIYFFRRYCVSSAGCKHIKDSEEVQGVYIDNRKRGDLVTSKYAAAVIKMQQTAALKNPVNMLTNKILICIHAGSSLELQLDSVCVCVCVELGPGDGERQDSGSQTGRLGQKPAELHFRPPPQQPVGEQVVPAAPQRPADLRGRPHHGCQEPAGLAGQVRSPPLTTAPPRCVQGQSDFCIIYIGDGKSSGVADSNGFVFRHLDGIFIFVLWS